MPIEVTRYLCEKCQQEFPDEFGAKSCELRPFLDDLADTELGQEIDFFREHQTPGASVATYFKDKGVVLHKTITYNQKYNKHQHILMCACKDDEGLDVERGVLLIIVASGDKDNPDNMLFSPMDMLFKPGFVKSMEKQSK